MKSIDIDLQAHPEDISTLTYDFVRMHVAIWGDNWGGRFSC